MLYEYKSLLSKPCLQRTYYVRYLEKSVFRVANLRNFLNCSFAKFFRFASFQVLVLHVGIAIP